MGLGQHRSTVRTACPPRPVSIRRRGPVVLEGDPRDRAVGIFGGQKHERRVSRVCRLRVDGDHPLDPGRAPGAGSGTTLRVEEGVRPAAAGTTEPALFVGVAAWHGSAAPGHWTGITQSYERSTCCFCSM